MHTLNLPPGHLLRMALLALLLTVMVMVLVAAVRPATIELGSGGSTDAQTPAPAEQVRTSPDPPSWVADPLAPPTLRLAR
jgi:hypothetical protein